MAPASRTICASEVASAASAALPPCRKASNPILPVNASRVTATIPFELSTAGCGRRKSPCNRQYFSNSPGGQASGDILPPAGWRDLLAVTAAGVCFASSALTELKTLEFAPTPNDSVITAIKVKHCLFADIRSALRRYCQSLCIIPPNYMSEVSEEFSRLTFIYVPAATQRRRDGKHGRGCE